MRVPANARWKATVLLNVCPTAQVAALCCMAAAAPSQMEWRFGPEKLREQHFMPTSGSLTMPAPTDPQWVAGALVRTSDTPPLVAARPLAARELPKRALTVEAWVAVDQPAPWGGFVCAIEDNADFERGWMLGYRDRQITFGLASTESRRMIYLGGPPALLQGVWHHVVGTYDGRQMLLYVDGELSARSTEASGPIAYAPQHRLAIGAYLDTDEEHRMVGALHSVAVLDKVLDAADVRARHAKLRPGLLDQPGNSLSGVEPPLLRPLAELQPHIDGAIQRGVLHLLHTQHRDGSWDHLVENYRNGGTALATLALLKSGVPKEHAAIEAAMHFLAQQEPQQTYSASCQLLALAATGDRAYRPAAQRLSELLLAWESKEEPGSWGYPTGRADLSNAQFAALGFSAAARLGVDVPAAVWRRIAVRTVQRHQPLLRPPGKRRPDGTSDLPAAGFTYWALGETWPVSGSMTAAGLCLLALAEQFGGDTLGAELRATMAESRTMALQWLGRSYSSSGNPGEPPTHYYHLYGIERIGALLSLDTIGGHPWYRDGAEWLVAAQSADGGWQRHDQTCFALLFLTRATAPTTGPRAAPVRGSWAVAGGDVALRAHGFTAFQLWIDAAGAPARTIRRVRYFADGVTIGTVDRTAGSDVGQAFLTQYTFEHPGAHVLEAEVEFVDGGATARSQPLPIQVEPDSETWVRAHSAKRAPNLLSEVRKLVTASSAAEDRAASRALDGLEATAWQPAADDIAPRLRVEVREPVLAQAVVVGPATSRFADRNPPARIQRGEVWVNGSRIGTFGGEADDGTEPWLVRLAGRTPVKTIEIRLLERQPGTGIAEFGLR